MDMEVLSSVFQVVAYPNCSNTKLELSESKKNGLASQMDLKCSKCLWNHSFCNSKKTQRAHHINRTEGDGCFDEDAIRIKNSCRQSGEYMKTRRRMLRGLRKSKTLETKKEGKVYGAGVAS